MKTLKYFTIALLALSLGACTKNNDHVKEVLETALPSIEVTSLGLLTQTGPFIPSNAIQVTFNGAITKSEPGVFDYAWYDGNTRVDTVHFDSWTQAAGAATANNAITTTFIPTTYANTQAFTGNLVMKLAALTAGKSYSLFVYARTKDDKMARMSVTRLITIK